MFSFLKKKKKKFYADGIGVKGRTLDFLKEEKFTNAWQYAQQHALFGWGVVPDIRWRAHIALWAAQHGLDIEGDFVECGVFTGLLSLTICHYLDFAKIDKKFYLYDSWNGMPDDNKHQYNQGFFTKKRLYEKACDAFAPYPNCHLIKGFVPQTLYDKCPEKIAYLSMDLNHAESEKAAIEFMWTRLSHGALIVIDDYALYGYEDQKLMWDQFADKHQHHIVTLPTGQELLIKKAI